MGPTRMLWPPSGQLQGRGRQPSQRPRPQDLLPGARPISASYTTKVSTMSVNEVRSLVLEGHAFASPEMDKGCVWMYKQGKCSCKGFLDEVKPHHCTEWQDEKAGFYGTRMQKVDVALECWGSAGSKVLA